MTEATRVLDEAIERGAGRRAAVRARRSSASSCGWRPRRASAPSTRGASPKPRCRCSSATATTTASAGPGRCARRSTGSPARSARADEAWREAAGCAGRAGDERELFEVLGWRATRRGVRPDAGRRGDRPLRGVPRASSRRARSRVAWTINALAVAARDDAASSSSRERFLREANETLDAARRAERRACRITRRSCGCSPAGPSWPRRRCARASSGWRRWATAGCWRRRPRCSRRRSTRRDALDEAGELCALARAAAAADDIVTQVIWRGVQREGPRRATAAARRPGARARGGRARRARPTCSRTTAMRCSTWPRCCLRARARTEARERRAARPRAVRGKGNIAAARRGSVGAGASLISAPARASNEG